MATVLKILNWPWLIWQVGVPLGGPILVSGLIVLAWQTGNPDFVPQWSIVLDVSPWALTFYGMALIGASLEQLWPQMPSHAFIGCGLIGTAAFMATYTAFMVVWRHNSGFVPARSVYFLAGALLLLAIIFSYLACSDNEDLRHDATV